MNKEQTLAEYSVALADPEQSKIFIKVVAEKPELLPMYASLGAAGADVRANIESDVTLLPQASCLIGTGCKFDIPAGYEIQVRSRSGLALKNQVVVLNSPGTIDSDYRGELGVILMNHGAVPFVVTPGMRIAQIVVARVVQGDFVLSEGLSDSKRGSGGFGHTGV